MHPRPYHKMSTQV